MTGRHDERATGEPRRSKRSRPEAKAAEPPARRPKRAEGHVPPPKRRAARVARPSSPPHGHRDSEDVAVAPPPARRVEAPAPPPKPEHPVRPNWHRTAYRLRNRVVPDTSNRKPAPSRYDNGIEIKHDVTWQTPTCARVALEHYNNMNQGDEHEMVKAVSSHVFVFNGIWFHANFLAKRKGATTCVDLVPKYFFAELEIVGTKKLSCVSCVKLDPGDPQNIGGCSLCYDNIMHPAGGGYHGAQARSV
ncbi:uncharacterized protein LOC125512952 [Triticum urartu]|uniref:DUF3615 domain-containing protein n=1 Tax=Triticum urartu TaxID=4572 RepID=A0A8R7QWG6_TRIUA|nr:uncharacterized protein LOC125512952 [Triticum urartu]